MKEIVWSPSKEENYRFIDFETEIDYETSIIDQINKGDFKAISPRYFLFEQSHLNPNRSAINFPIKQDSNYLIWKETWRKNTFEKFQIIPSGLKKRNNKKTILRYIINGSLIESEELISLMKNEDFVPANIYELIALNKINPYFANDSQAIIAHSPIIEHKKTKTKYLPFIGNMSASNPNFGGIHLNAYERNWYEGIKHHCSEALFVKKSR